MTTWTDAQILKLQVLHGLMDFGGIAKELKMTRNAVIGKAHRLGLVLPEGHKRKVRGRDRKPRLKVVRIPKAKAAKGALEGLPIEPPSIEDLSIPFAQRKALLELGPQDCRWPVGEPTEFFCGGKVVAGRSYCPGHFRRSRSDAPPQKPRFMWKDGFGNRRQAA